MLEVNSIYLYRNRKQVFDNFSLNLNKSEIIQLEGENGVGKTSLLNMISGLISPDKGFIEICKKDITELGKYKKKKFTYIPDKNCLKENFTVNENLKSWMKLSNLGTNYNTYQKALNTFSLNDIQGSLVKNLSQGQKKKVALTKLLFSESKLWLLDEPLNGIDTKTKMTLKKIMIQHLKQNGSILFSSHVKSNMKLTRRIILKKIIKKLNIQLLDKWENFK
ncbi:MAG: heme ABC exporter ATP-binding protein CcmA [Rickettsiales bacterium]|nr:heme ABC exporter ATP-binding protein CcmA [Rickettsiales bacterium]RPG15517.1 MAG: heme ABC exporter ATP-binding protein CcmA [Pelagibacteraceae bacterium TMED195]|tara:strand:- start:2290 stop:2952 length:663 start_codon:yes stop_codon:yes gene_type:complete